jgi:hypothetical protein
MPATVAGSTIAVVGGLGVAGRIWWAWAYGRAVRFPVLPVVTGLGTSAAVLLLLASATPGTASFSVGLVLHAACAMAMPEVLFLAAISAVRPAAAGRVSGYVASCQFSGFAAGPALVQRSQPRAATWQRGRWSRLWGPFRRRRRCGSRSVRTGSGTAIKAGSLGVRNATAPPTINTMTSWAGV